DYYCQVWDSSGKF
nr:immunoglobulin light chain junction region [Macaca mulatta]MOW06926.1 immunoglobulin light chain junction region [Macaca mulatta]